MLGPKLRAIRDSTGLGPARFARLAGVEVVRLEAWEAGAAEPLPEEVDAVARIVGVRIADLSRAGGWPLQPFLFRASGHPGLDALEESRTFGTIGDVLRSAADVCELEAMLGMTPAPLPALKPPAAAHAPWGARELASAARAKLGLTATGPVVSMRHLVESLGIRVLFVTPEKLAPAFQAASTIRPRPMILVNLVGGRDAFWQVRMAIAHELGHLLFDHQVGDDTVNVSAAGIADSMRLSDDYLRVESRADAFAAMFVAPDAAVRDLIAHLSVAPSAGRAIQEVARTFGLGRVTAVNRLKDVYQLSDSTRDAMLRRDVRWDTGFDDVPRNDEIGFAPVWLCELVGRAVAAGCLDRVRAREMLGLTMTDPLPTSTRLEQPLCRPLRA